MPHESIRIQFRVVQIQTSNDAMDTAILAIRKIQQHFKKLNLPRRVAKRKAREISWMTDSILLEIW
jgi:hypothetical protein